MNFELRRVVGISVFLRVGVWQVCYVNVEEQGRQNRSLWDAVVDAFQSALLAITCFHDNAVIEGADIDWDLRLF